VTSRGEPLELLKVWEGGLSFHGGLLGGFRGRMAIYIARREVSIPAGRRSCLRRRSRSATRSRGSAAFSTAAATARLPTSRGRSPCPTSQARGPSCPAPSGAQLYAALASLAVIFGLLLLVRRHLRRQGASLPRLPDTSTPRARFGVEFFRRGVIGLSPLGRLPALTVAQFASICIAVAAGGRHACHVWDLRRSGRH
jgi:prolipoprotein diacylglyceryltransferase